MLNELVDRTGVDPALIEDVIMGCVSQGGEQAINVGRNAVLASKLPESVPGTSVDRQCGSSQQAIQFAAQAVMCGTQDVVIAARRREHDARADGRLGRRSPPRRAGHLYEPAACRSAIPTSSSASSWARR